MIIRLDNLPVFRCGEVDAPQLEISFGCSTYYEVP